MFTGIIEEMGSVLSLTRGSRSCSLKIQAKKVLEDTKTGDSIAVNGVCLTVTALGPGYFTADVMPETLNRSSLAGLAPKDLLNLERAMALGGRLGGHLVSGHIDGTGRISQIMKDDNAIWYTIEAPEQILALIVEKGSVAVDGTSLTVACKKQGSFQVSLIPHTVSSTILASKKTGDRVNLENDCIGKYVQQLLFPDKQGPSDSLGSHSPITRDFLTTYGF